MIPRTIHFSWISGEKYPLLVNRCMRSWKKYAPDYEIICWDKNRFDINSLMFTKEAYQQKKWAFVADVQRLYALYHHGGIYLDSDVELFRPLDSLLNNNAFIGFEDDQLLSLGVLGSESGHPWIKKLLDYYNDIPFVRDDGSFDTTPNTFIVTRMTQEDLALQLVQSEQLLKHRVRVYPRTFFSPKDFKTGRVCISSDTYSIHHFSSSWMPLDARLFHKYQRFKHGMKFLMRRAVGTQLVDKLLDHKRRMFNR